MWAGLRITLRLCFPVSAITPWPKLQLKILIGSVWRTPGTMTECCDCCIHRRLQQQRLCRWSSSLSSRFNSLSCSHASIHSPSIPNSQTNLCTLRTCSESSIALLHRELSFKTHWTLDCLFHLSSPVLWSVEIAAFLHRGLLLSTLTGNAVQSTICPCSSLLVGPVRPSSCIKRPCAES